MDEAGRSPRILLVEDDQAVRAALASALQREGYEVRAEADGTDLEALLEDYRPDLAVLDVWLPGDRDGFALAEAVRSEAGIPVFFLTAADSLEDRLRGFEVGADDYVVKPFSTAELLARVRAVLRRSGRDPSPSIEVRDLLVDEADQVVRRSGVDVDLTPTEFELLAVLARNAGRVLSKVQLLSLVWHFDEFEPNLVEVHISSLRRKLEAHGPRLIHTQRGQGYVLR